jgi:hypothetical protein
LPNAICDLAFGNATGNRGGWNPAEIAVFRPIAGKPGAKFAAGSGTVIAGGFGQEIGKEINL